MNEVEQNIVICQWRADQIIICWSQRLRQIIDLRDIDKSRYFAITKFNNCFIIRSPFFWSTKYIKSLSACSELIGHFHMSVVSITHEQNIIWSKTLICRQLFAGHVVSSRPLIRKEKIHWMITIIIVGL